MEKKYTEKQVNEIVSLSDKLDEIGGEILSTKVYFEEEIYKWGGIPDKGRTMEQSYGIFLKEAKKLYQKSRRISKPYQDVESIKAKQGTIEEDFQEVKTLADRIYEINKKRK